MLNLTDEVAIAFIFVLVEIQIQGNEGSIGIVRMKEFRISFPDIFTDSSSVKVVDAEMKLAVL
jgi:hypothetical protein